MASLDQKFKGWVSADDTGKAVEGNLVFETFEPKAWDEDDVDVRILYCGICGSDASFLSGEFGPTAKGTCAGHEAVGEIIKVGSQVENGLKLGDMVGIGAQSDSCHECSYCQKGSENYCAKQTITFGAPYFRGNAGEARSVSKGGFAKYWRGPSRFAILIPEGLDPAYVGPLMCGGVTVFSPLQRFGAGTSAMRVGVLGMGGLGHMAVLFAKAMGAEVTAISRSDSKKQDALELGATKYIATGDDVAKAVQGHERSLDLIICTINPHEFPQLADYLKLVDAEGTFVMVGIVPMPLSVSAFPLITGAVGIAGSNIGSPRALTDMLKLAAEKQIRPWIQKYDMDDINKALPDFKAGKPRYRFVLVNTDNGGKM